MAGSTSARARARLPVLGERRSAKNTGPVVRAGPAVETSRWVADVHVERQLLELAGRLGHESVDRLLVADLQRRRSVTFIGSPVRRSDLLGRAHSTPSRIRYHHPPHGRRCLTRHGSWPKIPAGRQSWSACAMLAALSHPGRRAVSTRRGGKAWVRTST